MKANALAQGQTEFAAIASMILLERFPTALRKGGGTTPTTVVFRGHSEHFSTGKYAFIWLVGEFSCYCPGILDEYESLHARAKSAGRRFAKDPALLFPPGSKRVADPSYYARVANGWFADVNLNHKDKFAALMQLAYLAKL